jgi:hypothetical protein
MGMILFEGEQGWQTQTELLPLLNRNGAIINGVIIQMKFQRSSSVKFFSLFVVILLWTISLAMFAIALNFCISDSTEIAYDVPALAIGLLFALPFFRDVQPDVPKIGIIVDMMGFFFNLILVALSAGMTMFALVSRHFRAIQLESAKREGKPGGGTPRLGSQQLPLDLEMQQQHPSKSSVQIVYPTDTTLVQPQKRPQSLTTPKLALPSPSNDSPSASAVPLMADSSSSMKRGVL